MSGPLRQVIGPQKARLKQLLSQSHGSLALDLDNLSPDNQLKEISKLRITLRNEVQKITRVIDLLRQKETDWIHYIQTLGDETRQKDEEALLNKAMDGADGLVALTTCGDDKVADLDSSIEELNFLYARAEHKLLAQAAVAPQAAPGGPGANGAAASGGNNRGSSMKLPKVDLPKFNGDSSKWNHFFDLFVSAVQDQPISDVQKLNYLFSLCSGPALAAISGLSITNDNYQVAMDILRKRFGDNAVIIRTLYSKLEHLQVQGFQTKDLRKFLDSLESIIRQLESLGEAMEQNLLVNQIRRKLSQDLLTEMQKLKPDDAAWTVKLVREKLQKVIEVREEIESISVGLGSVKVPKGAKGSGTDTRTEHHGPSSSDVAGASGNPLSSVGAMHAGNRAAGVPGAQESLCCVFCDGEHLNKSCTTCTDYVSRIEALKKKGKLVCFKCLKPNHRVATCRSKIRCFVCKKGHNGLLHNPNFPPKRVTGSHNPSNVHGAQIQPNAQGTSNSPDGQMGSGSQGSYTCGAHPGLAKNANQSSRSAMLQTAVTKVLNRFHPDEAKSVKAQLFLDNGSQRSFITTAMAKQLSLAPVEEECLEIYTFSSEKPQQKVSPVVEFEVLQRDGSMKKVVANVMDRLTATQQRHPLSDADQQYIAKYYEVSFFADTFPSKAAVFHPDVLIGQDFYWDFMIDQPKVKLPSGMYIISSHLGLLLGGQQDLPNGGGSMCQSVQSMPLIVQTLMNQSVPELCVSNETGSHCFAEPNMEDFWSLEGIGIMDSPDVQDDDVAIEHFNKTVIYEDGRYFVKWPFKSEFPELPDNKELALKRFKSQLKKLKLDHILFEKYCFIFDDQQLKYIIEMVPDDELETENLTHYLPHHPVVTPDKATTKVRGVFDASAHQVGQPSLNDCLLRGRVLLPDLCGLLLRSRMWKIVVASDVEKAFLQVGLQKADKDLTRFFCLKDPKQIGKESNIQVFRFKKVPFGVKSSPFLLEATVKYHLGKYGSPVAKMIAENIYVDNVVAGAYTLEDALQIHTESKQIFREASMNLREYTSNSAEFMSQIPASDAASKTGIVKLLGLTWDLSTDNLIVKCPSATDDAMTKRSVTRIMASVFDPLGLASPAVLQGKLLIQELWKNSFGWDDPMSPELQAKWQKIKNGLHDISVSRFVEYFPTGESELHMFVDASGKAFATCAYIRHEVDGEWKSHLLLSKTRVAPLKQKTTIPRLELLALLIGNRLTKFMTKEVPISLVGIYFWSDSSVCLYWLKTVKPLARFLENRLMEITKIRKGLPSPVEFRYVPSEENPADVASRGCTFQELQKNDMWFFGPSWLREKELPNFDMPPITESLLKEIEEEVRKTAKPVYETAVHAVQGVQDQVESVIALERFSSLKRLLRTTAYVLRFINMKVWRKLRPEVKLKSPLLKKLLEPMQMKGSILFKEMKAAKLFWCGIIQQSAFPEVLNVLQNEGKPLPKRLVPSTINQLGLQLDKNGLIRCHGRLDNASELHPVLLPKKHKFTELVVQDCHFRALHSGVQQTLLEVRSEFWIPQGRALVKSLLRSCHQCRRVQGGAYNLPAMPPLPKERVTRAYPFEFTGLDYLGPIYCKRGDEKMKTWACLCTCLVTRAIHLELVPDMSAQQFLLALRRFIARWGPKKLISDNATQFKLVSETMSKAANSAEDSDVIGYTSSQSIDWQFITPFAPWQGGVYERMVGLVKSSLKKAVGRKMLTYDELITLLTEICAVVNSRPLTYVNSDLDSQKILRPMDFLHTSGAVGTPEFDQEENDDPSWVPKLDSSMKLLKYWQSSLLVLDKFWDLFYKDYLESLREKNKQHQVNRAAPVDLPKEGDVVLIHEELLPRASWKLGRIHKLKPSHDGHLRAAEVLLSNRNTVQRPINKLYPVEVAMVSSELKIQTPDPEQSPGACGGSSESPELPRKPVQVVQAHHAFVNEVQCDIGTWRIASGARWDMVNERFESSTPTPQEGTIEEWPSPGSSGNSSRQSSRSQSPSLFTSSMLQSPSLFTSSLLIIAITSVILPGSWAEVLAGIPINRTYVLCAKGRSGHPLHVPATIQCDLPQPRWLLKKRVRLWVERDLPMKTVGFRCYLSQHTMFTRTGFMGGKGIVGEKITYSPVTPSGCWSTIKTTAWNDRVLVEMSEGFWSTNNSLIVNYKWCCYDVSSSISNFQIEEGEIASLDGRRLVTDLQDFSHCKPEVGFCQSQQGVTVWDSTVFQRQCAYVAQGTYQATLSGTSIVVDAIQGAFSYSGKQNPPNSDCVPEKALYADQGGVFVEFLNKTPNEWLRMGKKDHLIVQYGYNAKEDLDNFRKFYFFRRLEDIERKQFTLVWHQLCLLKQGQLNLALQLLRIDPTLGLRAHLGKDNIHAEWSGEALIFWACRNVTPSIIYFSGNVKGTCYQYTPVQLKPEDDFLMFVSPGSRDLVADSPIQDCGHSSPHMFQTSDGQWFSANGVVHVTEVPVEVPWKGLWEAFTFNAPSLFHNRISLMGSSFYTPRYHTLKIFRLEQTVERLVNYTASMALDPSVVSQTIIGVGESIGHVFTGVGAGIGHIIEGVATGAGGLINQLLSGPVQLFITVAVIAIIGALLLFGLWKARHLQICKKKTPKTGASCFGACQKKTEKAKKKNRATMTIVDEESGPALAMVEVLEKVDEEDTMEKITGYQPQFLV